MGKGILINLFYFTPASATGVFVYVDNLLQELAKMDSKYTYWLIVRKDMCHYLQNVLGNKPNVRYKVFGNLSFFWPRIAAKLLHKRSIVEESMRRKFQSIIDKHDISTVFFPSGSINPRGLRDISTIVTLFDLQYEYLPENFPPKYLKVRREGNQTAAQSANRILAISEFTNNTLVEKYGIQTDKIVVTLLAPQKFEEPEPVELPQQYVFYPAAFWPHKNHAVLIEALALLKHKFPKLHVVLTGIEKWQNVLADVLERADRHGIRDRIHHLGHVSSGSLRTIYEKSAALIFPSAFEGFGIPLVEAFSLGVPVIAANNSSITEVVGGADPVRNRAHAEGVNPEDRGAATSSGAGILVPTGNAKALANAIEQVLTDPKLRSGLIAKGYARAKLFSWEKTAQKTLDVFDELS